MGTVLQIDTGAVRSVSDDLTSITGELTDAQAHSDSVADAVGHEGLAGALRNFAGSWDDRRRGLIEQIAQLRDAATAIADTFDDVDSQLARALTEGASAANATAGPSTARGASAV